MYLTEFSNFLSPAYLKPMNVIANCFIILRNKKNPSKCPIILVFIPLVLDKHLMVTIERCKNNNLNKFNCTFVYQKGGSQRIYIYIQYIKGGNYVNVLMCTIYMH